VTNFRVVTSEPVVDRGWFTLDRITVEGPDGARFEREALRHPGAVDVVAVHDDRTVSMVRQFRAALDREVLEVVAGRRDVDGEDPERTAARELAEEVGLSAGMWVKLTEFHNSVGITDELSFVFLAQDLEPLPADDRQGPEEQHMVVERIALDDVDRLIATGEIHDGKSIIALLLARDFLDGRYAGWQQ